MALHRSGQRAATTLADRAPQSSGNRNEQPDRPERAPRPGGENRGEEREYSSHRSGEQRDADEGRGAWQPEEQPNFDDAR